MELEWNAITLNYASWYKNPRLNFDEYCLFARTVSCNMSKLSESVIKITHDNVNEETMKEEYRMRLIKLINSCEIDRKLLDTSVVDQVLSPFGSLYVFICPTYTPKQGQNAPYYKEYLVNDQKKLNPDIEMVVVPLCDNYHFNGYVIDRKRKMIVHVDSMFHRLSGRRSVGSFLAKTFLPDEENVQFLSFYPKCIQKDAHSCGAWLVLGLVVTLFGIPKANRSFTLEMAFSLLMVLIDKISEDEKVQKAMELFGGDEDMTMTKHFGFDISIVDEHEIPENEQKSDVSDDLGGTVESDLFKGRAFSIK